MRGSRVLLPMLAAVLASGCIFGERLGGPTLSVRNDSATDVVLRMDRSRWQVAAGEAGPLDRLPVSALGSRTTIEVLAADCRSIASVQVDFDASPDQIVVIPRVGDVTSRPLAGTDPRSSATVPGADPGRCPTPADGWSLFVVNETPTAYELETVTPDAGGVVPPQRAVFLIGAGASGAIVWPTVPNTTAGSIDIFDPGQCQLVARLEHGAYGTFVITIDGGRATILPGPMPASAERLPGEIPRATRPCQPDSS